MTWQHRRRGCAAALSDRIFFVLPPAEFGTRQREPHAGSVATALLGQQPRRPTERAATAEIGQCLALSFGFFFTFCAWHSAQNLQSSLPLHRGVKGTTALAIVYCLLGPGNFSAPAVVQRVGLKRTIILAMGMYGSFIAANIFPRWYTIYPAAVAVGLACPPLFVAQNTFLTALAIAYAQKKKLPEKTARVGMFQGMFNAIFMTTQLFGNSFYGLVFRHFGGGSTVIKGLFTFYLCLVVVGMLLIAAALDDQLPPACESEEDVKSQPLQPPVKRVTTTAVLFAPKMLWLLPLQGAGGFMSSFITADFTARIVKVSLGEANLGFVMAVSGAAGAAGNAVFGRLSDAGGGTSRMLIFAIGLWITVGVGVLLFIYKPMHSSAAWTPVLVAAVSIGLSGAMTQCMLSAHLSANWIGQTACAFACSNMMAGFSSGFAFFLAGQLPMQTMLAVAIPVQIVGGLGFAASVYICWKQSTERVVNSAVL